MRIPYYMETLEKVDEEEGVAEESSEEVLARSSGGLDISVAPETPSLKDPPQAAERPSLKNKKMAGVLEPLVINAMNNAGTSEPSSPDDNDTATNKTTQNPPTLVNKTINTQNPIYATKDSKSGDINDANDACHGSNRITNGLPPTIKNVLGDDKNGTNSSENKFETAATDDDSSLNGFHRLPNGFSTNADGPDDGKNDHISTTKEIKKTTHFVMSDPNTTTKEINREPTNVVHNTNLNDPISTSTEHNTTTTNDTNIGSNEFIASTNKPTNTTSERNKATNTINNALNVTNTDTNGSNTTQIEPINTTDGSKTSTDESDNAPNCLTSENATNNAINATNNAINATNTTQIEPINTTDGSKTSTEESDNAPDSITSEINTPGPHMSTHRTVNTSNGPTTASNGEEPVSVGVLDSLSPCTTPFESTDLEFDNYDGQFVFVGPEFEPSVQMLQQQMSVLADNQTHTDERYSRVKQENAGLQARILMLEEQLRDVEIRAEERLAEEEKRHRELIGRVDREKILQVENCAIRLQNIETENVKLKEDAGRLRAALDKAKEDNERLTDNVELNEAMIMGLKQDLANARVEDRKQKDVIQNQQQIIEELSKELELVKQEKVTALTALTLSQDKDVTSPLRTELDSLRIQHKELQESHDELQAMLLSQGRSLISSGTSNTLAAEFAAMSQDDSKVMDSTDLATTSCASTDTNNVPAPSPTKIKSALQEQQEVNAQLRSYIETILTMILEQQPELLEVKMKKPEGC